MDDLQLSINYRHHLAIQILIDAERYDPEELKEANYHECDAVLLGLIKQHGITTTIDIGTYDGRKKGPLSNEWVVRTWMKLGLDIMNDEQNPIWLKTAIKQLMETVQKIQNAKASNS